MLFLPFPINTLLVPAEGAKLYPLTVRAYPPPFCPLVIDNPVTTIL
jgi:hypothetical protein